MATDVPGLSEDAVLALAPDDASIKAAKGLLNPAQWPSKGVNAQALWGECQGSGSKPYQTQIDLTGPVCKCSCPSRKLPCKHSLALLLLAARQQIPPSDDAPAWVQEWLDSRRERAGKKEAQAAEKAAKPFDPAAAAKRDAKRWQRVQAGLQELSLWLQDRITHGLAPLQDDAHTRAHWHQQAARMVDAQAPALAQRIRDAAEGIGAGPQWAHTLLAELAFLQLLADAARRQAQLPDGLRADLMAALGWPVEREQVLAQGQAVEDTWQVIGRLVHEREGRLLERQVWLQGQRSGRIALLLDFAHGAQRFELPWPLATAHEGRLVFYPGAAPLRALWQGQGQPQAHAHAPPESTTPTPAQAQQPPAACLARPPHPPASSWREATRRFALNPFAPNAPLWCPAATLHYQPEPSVPQSSAWQLHWAMPADEGANKGDGTEAAGAETDASANAPASLPLEIDDDAAWQWLAHSGGQPVHVFGAWNGQRLRPFSAWRPGGGLVWSAPRQAL